MRRLPECTPLFAGNKRKYKLAPAPTWTLGPLSNLGASSNSAPLSVWLQILPCRSHKVNETWSRFRLLLFLGSEPPTARRTITTIDALAGLPARIVGVRAGPSLCAAKGRWQSGGCARPLASPPLQAPAAAPQTSLGNNSERQQQHEKRDSQLARGRSLARGSNGGGRRGAPKIDRAASARATWRAGRPERAPTLILASQRRARTIKRARASSPAREKLQSLRLSCHNKAIRLRQCLFNAPPSQSLAACRWALAARGASELRASMRQGALKLEIGALASLFGSSPAHPVAAVWRLMAPLAGSH